MTKQNQTPSNWAHLRDIFLLPFTVTIILPALFFHSPQIFIFNNWILPILCFGFIGLGLSLLFITISLFKRLGEGTLAPWQPTQKLIIAGPYKYCRNPMITGVLFILIGEFFLFLSYNHLILIVCFFTANTLYFIYSEEPRLVLRFGQEYTIYKQNVPRWIPRLKPYTPKS
ncbi:methyltransferase family protein [Leptospira johnsonii]|uniref:RemK protein n=1 Tax=Leptospira johnsonii TaxID=1917820 RepID=A0A2P2D3G4_9LEPT|nr:isoprenylcysteine carboxylmethyltransferase family protein [Leptospira johnsonii]GBF39189.1 RemK protein [Leptospira johnsonii]